ncbi:MAG TPA: tautomerase family protein [Limnochordales bacterium]|nr:tautomerase family protein [Limnochordales bacterium]
MVMVRVHMMQGRTSEQKAELIARLTDVVTRRLAVAPEDVRVIVLEVSPDGWGIAGVPATIARRAAAGGAP